jgi:hypothetical protein
MFFPDSIPNSHKIIDDRCAGGVTKRNKTADPALSLMYFSADIDYTSHKCPCEVQTGVVLS